MKELGLSPPERQNAAHMHRDIQCYTSQAPVCISHLFLLIRHRNAGSASDECASLYGCVGHCVGHGNVAEVVLADSLDSVCVWACNQLATRLWISTPLLRTDCTDKSKENHSSHDISDEVWLTSAVKSGGRFVLLVVVRRLGHAARRISF